MTYDIDVAKVLRIMQRRSSSLLLLRINREPAPNLLRPRRSQSPANLTVALPGRLRRASTLAIVSSYYVEQEVHVDLSSHSSLELCQRVPVSFELQEIQSGRFKRTSVDAVRYGIQTLGPKFFGSAPDFVVSGPNIGCKHYSGFDTGITILTADSPVNLGPGVSGSGTV